MKNKTFVEYKRKNWIFPCYKQLDLQPSTYWHINKSLLHLYQKCKAVKWMHFIVCSCTAWWLQAGLSCGSTPSCTEGAAVSNWRSYSGLPQCGAGGGRCGPWWMSTWPTFFCAAISGLSPADSPGRIIWLCSLVSSVFIACVFLLFRQELCLSWLDALRRSFHLPWKSHLVACVTCLYQLAVWRRERPVTPSAVFRILLQVWESVQTSSSPGSVPLFQLPPWSEASVCCLLRRWLRPCPSFCFYNDWLLLICGFPGAPCHHSQVLCSVCRFFSPPILFGFLPLG